MSVQSLSEQLIDWAVSAAAEEFDLGSLDRESEAAADAFRAALSRPADISVVEHIEGLAKQLWADVLEEGNKFDEDNALACGAFFSRLGFLFKYKPYGVKIASPFGYSLFDLKDGEGFSFQLHMEPKLEGFHILRPKSGALVYISSREEWLHEGEAWARSALIDGDQVPAPGFVWRPDGGDVVEVSTTGVVHSVLGCVLEEYASCSVDAVERLLDQNARSSVVLPAGHPDVARLLAHCRPGLPARRVDRTETGWMSSAWSGREAVIKVDGDLWGSRLMLAGDQPYSLDAHDEILSIVVAVDSGFEVRTAGGSMRVPQGTFACLPPGVESSLSAPGAGCAVAVHCVSRKLIQADWTR